MYIASYGGYSGKIAKYWDEIQKKVRNYEVESQFFHKIFERERVNSVLDIGCGTGTHLIYLAELGYECTGIDNSPDMLEVARKKAEKMGLKIVFIESDMRDIRLEKKYDAIISMYAICQPDIEDIKKILTSINRTLKDHGVLIFNVMSMEGLPYKPDLSTQNNIPRIFLNMEILRDGKDVKIVRLGSTIWEGSIQDWDATYLIEENDKFSFEVSHQKLRLFHFDEIKSLLENHDFRLESVTHRQIKEVKDMLICVLKKR